MDERDSIDFGGMDIRKLFIRLFIPTLLGLMFGALVCVTDGIFVGRGVGSDALAAINIASPLFLISTGIALMFGSGVSIVAAIHLSHYNYKAANINVTQALTVSIAVMCLLCTIAFLFPEYLAFLFGSSEKLTPIVVEYLLAVLPSFMGSMILVIGMFVLRLDGAPRLAMAANMIASVLNIILDYMFVFPWDMGIRGAGIATSISQWIGAILVIVYMLWYPKTIHLYKPKFTKKSIRLTIRNVGYMVRLGLSAFIGESAMACIMIVGNFVFMSRLQEDGVAAFSVACYLLPLIFMFGNSVTQSTLPIISYNHGRGNTERIKRTFRMSIIVAVVFGVFSTIIGVFWNAPVINLFLENGQSANSIARNGFSYYSLCFLFFLLNLVLVGYLQSLEKFKPATFFMLLRSYILIIPCFVFLPMLIGNKGLWLALPLSEFLTFIAIVIYMKVKTK